jgi:glycerol-3-phosphate responsive antiterminator
VAAKLLSQLETYYQLTILLKVQLSAIFNLQLVIKVHTQDALVHMQLLLGIQMTVAELELDYLQVLERLFQETAELQLELLLVEEEMKSQL